MVSVYLFALSAIILLGAVLLHSQVRANRLWLALLVLTLPIASVNELRGVEVTFSLSDAVMLGLALHAVGLAAFSQRPLRLPLIGLLTPFFLWVVISMIIGANRFGSGSPLLYLIALAKFAALFAYLFVIVNLARSKEDLRLLLQTWVITSTVVGIFGILGPLISATTGTPLSSHPGFRAQGTLEAANLFAAYSLLSFFLAAALLTDTRGIRARIFVLLCMGVQVLAILLSASRGAAVAFILTAPALAIACGSPRLRRSLLGMAALPALLLFALPLASPTAENRLAVVVNRLLSAQDLESRAHVERYFLWRQAASLFAQNPLLGVGSANFRLIIANDREMRITKTPHNTFLRILSETGLVGLLLFLAPVSYCAAVLLRRIANRRTVTHAPMAACLFAALTAIAIHGLASDFGNFRGFWILLGVIYAFDSLHPLSSQPPAVTHAI